MKNCVFTRSIFFFFKEEYIFVNVIFSINSNGITDLMLDIEKLRVFTLFVIKNSR